MEVADHPLSAKRPSFDEEERPESNGKRRRRRFGGFHHSLLSSAHETVFRILCPCSKAGGIIGRGGSIIKSIIQDTGASINVEDPVRGVEERVVTISAKEARFIMEPQEVNKELSDKDEPPDDTKEDAEKLDASKTEKDVEIAATKAESDGEIKKADVSPAQEALVRVHARIVESEPIYGEHPEKQDPAKVVARLLVPSTQIGCLLGRKGKIIERMRKESGALIRVLEKEFVPGCALPSEELVQITGDSAAVRKALYAVSSQLQDNPPKDRDQNFGPAFPLGSVMPQPMDPFMMNANMFLPGNALGPQMDFRPPFSSPGHGITGEPLHPLGPPPFLSDHMSNLTEPFPPIELDVRFRILCPNDRIGSIIGKGGGIVGMIREETGAKIHVEKAAFDGAERVVLVYATEHANDNVSKAQEAALRIQSRLANSVFDKNSIVTNLLVPCDQVGCLIGKGGTIISEMRKTTFADINIYKKEQLPSWISKTDEIVQIIGDMKISQDAFFQITTRLRNNMIHEKLSRRFGENSFSVLPGPMIQGGDPVGNPIGPVGNSMGPFGNPIGPVGNSIGRFGNPLGPVGNPTGPIMNPVGNPTGPIMNPVGNPTGPVGGQNSQLGRRPEPVSPGRFFPAPSYLEPRGSAPNPQLPGNWMPHGQGLTGGNSHGFPPQPERGDTMRLGGPSLTTSNSVQVVVPEHVMGSIIGPGGSNLAQIREISGAEVRVHDLLPGATERIVEISGTPDQTHAAQSLLQAFIFSGQ